MSLNLSSRYGLCSTFVAAIFVVTSFLPANAQETSAVSSDLSRARWLMKSERLEEAYALLEQLPTELEEEEIERLFLLGRVEMMLEMPDKAAERFQDILVDQPFLIRDQRGNFRFLVLSYNLDAYAPAADA